MNIKDEIKALKEQKNAVILAHYYVADEIQEIADYVEEFIKKNYKENICRKK